jgi:hypothetical protein
MIKNKKQNTFKFNFSNFHKFEVQFSTVSTNINNSFSFSFFFFCAPILDVGLLTVVGVSCEASVQPAHSQAISCSPFFSCSPLSLCKAF